MNALEIRLPDRLDLSHLLDFARQIDACGRCDEMTLDMGGARHFPPFPMLFLAAKILEFRETNPQALVRLTNEQFHTYAEHMGFFRVAGFDVGRPLGPADKYAELGDLRNEFDWRFGV
jgi:hypothetical protein